jgi:hypothetical protein
MKTRKPLRRTRLRPRSDKAIARDEARRACVAAVIARDRVCQFPVLLAAYEREHGPLPIDRGERWCRGPLVAHEPKHRRNVDPTDPASCLLACAQHNDWAEMQPELAYRIGFLQRGNAEPYRKRR